MPSPDDTEAVVREFATLFADGSFAAMADLLSEAGREAVVESFPDEFREAESMAPEDAFEAYWRGLYGQYGGFEGVGAVRPDGDGATAELTFEDATVTAEVGVDGDAVTGFSFAPEYEPPEYVDEDAFDEREVTVDTGDVALDGVLALPEGPGPFPGVVLVHGAGVHDPDGTAGSSKLLKDIAWGLASEGVATLRYEKRLANHEVVDERYTLDSVVVDDAVAAIDELVAADEVAGDTVFVAGHSQGGMCAPRIAERHGGVAGVVVLDALADSTPDPDDLRFLRYELEPDGDLSDEQEEQLNRDRETFRRLAEGTFGADETIWGKPGTWHRSVTEYDPAATASGLEVPVFVLKTGRADEETQPELLAWLQDQDEKWRKVDLPAGSRVSFYRDLDHHLQEGFAPAPPVSLYFGGNVSPAVVADIVEWVREAAPSPGDD
jgi:hypothetical protein